MSPYLDAMYDLEVEHMLRESNAIEGIYSDEAPAYAKSAWNFLRERKTLTLHGICKVQKVLTIPQPEMRPNWRGYLREIPVYIGGRQAMDHTLVRESLLRWIRRANRLSDPIADHVAFERIHPFVDGNGRTGRILMNWQLERLGEPLQVFTADGRQDYYMLFRQPANESTI